MQNSGKPIVAIVGRPNVGKSTLFNRFIGTRQAVTSEVAGTTRDRVYGDGEWGGRSITFVDTGGLVEEQDELNTAVSKTAYDAIAAADAVLFVLDAAAGLTASDRLIAEQLRKRSTKILVLANKADSDRQARAALELYELGFDEVYPVSALHGKGTGDALDAVLKVLPESVPVQEEQPEMPRLALIGRPNVGKSTLFNSLTKSDGRIVSSIPHTTRDVGIATISTDLGELQLIDTAGVQRRGKSGKGVVKYSLLRTLRAIDEATVVALLLDAVEGPTVQDAHVAAYALDAGKSLIVVVNKWDLVEKTADIQEHFYDLLSAKLGFLPNPPVVFISAKHGARLSRLLQATFDVWEIAGRQVPTRQLNTLLQRNLDRLPGVSGRRPPKLYYATQTATHPPRFTCFVNSAASWRDTHRRFVINLIREEFGFLGTPIQLDLKAKQPKEAVS